MTKISSPLLVRAIVRDTPNHCVYTVNHYYFPGMLTVALLVIPAIYAFRQIWRLRPQTNGKPTNDAISEGVEL